MSLFNKNNKVETPKAAKAEKVQVAITGVKGLAAMDKISKISEALKKTFEGQVKATMLTKFIEFGFANKNKPESFVGFEEDATCSCEMRKKASNIALTEAEQELLTKYNIPTSKATSVIDTFVINPKYVADEKMLAIMEAALASHIATGALPEDLFQHQQEVSKVTVSDDSIKTLFNTDISKFEGETEEDKMNEFKACLSAVSVLATKPKLATDDMAAAMEILKAMTSEEEAA